MRAICGLKIKTCLATIVMIVAGCAAFAGPRVVPASEIELLRERLAQKPTTESLGRLGNAVASFASTQSPSPQLFDQLLGWLEAVESAGKLTRASSRYFEDALVEMWARAEVKARRTFALQIRSRCQNKGCSPFFRGRLTMITAEVFSPSLYAGLEEILIEALRSSDRRIREEVYSRLKARFDVGSLSKLENAILEQVYHAEELRLAIVRGWKVVSSADQEAPLIERQALALALKDALMHPDLDLQRLAGDTIAAIRRNRITAILGHDFSAEIQKQLHADLVRMTEFTRTGTSMLGQHAVLLLIQQRLSLAAQTKNVEALAQAVALLESLSERAVGLLQSVLTTEVSEVAQAIEEKKLAMLSRRLEIVAIRANLKSCEKPLKPSQLN